MVGLSALLALPAAWLTGCSVGNDMIAGMGSEVETAPPHGQSSVELPGPGNGESKSNALAVTPHQQSYLDALHSAGVTPSSDLSALSIGSYVCQARAAKQTDQAVWDFVAPLVRNDAREPASEGVMNSGAAPPSAARLHDETADYIRIATDQLC